MACFGKKKPCPRDPLEVSSGCVPALGSWVGVRRLFPPSLVPKRAPRGFTKNPKILVLVAAAGVRSFFVPRARAERKARGGLGRGEQKQRLQPLQQLLGGEAAV